MLRKNDNYKDNFNDSYISAVLFSDTLNAWAL